MKIAGSRKGPRDGYLKENENGQEDMPGDDFNRRGGFAVGLPNRSGFGAGYTMDW